jgi:AcrR family transcriptional regulator
MSPSRPTSSLERRERERADTRRKILDAAREMFARKGYAATTMRAIAQRIAYTPTAIYHHFKNKDALLTELTTQDFRSLAEAFQKTGGGSDPIEQLRKIGEAYVEFGLKHPMHYRLMFMTPRPARTGTPGLKQHDPSENAYLFLVQTCARALAAGRFRPEFKDAEEIAQILWGGVHGFVSLRIAKEHDDWVRWRNEETSARHLHQIMFTGLLKRGNP